MMSGAPLSLTDWDNFYVIVGSSAGALTGLQFVSIALIAEKQAGSHLEVRAFGTPTIVHFCVALLISAIACTPWHSLFGVIVCLGACGAGGVAYGLNVTRHARRQTGYVPDAEDWLWYVALPLGAYASLLVAAIALIWHPARPMFLVAAVAVGLLLIGIHNAWDTVTYVALQRRESSAQ